MRYYLAIDIGASSGRHIVGWKENGKLQTQEVYRFPNGFKIEQGSLVWNVEQLLEEVKRGIAVAKQMFPEIYSLSIDTWGVDYVLMDGDREILPAYCYRDSRTEAVIDAVHSRVPFSRLYNRTGCQFQPFNSVYQLYDDLQKGRLERASHILMIPEYLLYKLSGVMVREYTNATTTGLVCCEMEEFDKTILSALGFPERLFPKLKKPGIVIGMYDGIRCVLCATHDTASAVEGIPMEDNDPYISSGTWSLLGVKINTPITDTFSAYANYSNEGGVGYIRYQKNIMGMWVVNELRRVICPDMSFDEIVKQAQRSNCDLVVDVNTDAFLSPDNMQGVFDIATGNGLATVGDYFRCAYRSLAFSYKDALAELEKSTGREYKKLYIVGGGANNLFLNRLTEQITGREVVALPIEATALGNLKLQMEAEQYGLCRG